MHGNCVVAFAGVTPQLAARAVHALLHQLTPAVATRSLCILARHNPPPCLQSDIAVQQPGAMPLLQHGRYSCLSAPQQHPQLPAALQRHLNSPALLMQQAHTVQPIASLLVHRTRRQFLHTTASRATAADQGGSGEQYHQPPTAQDAAAQQQPELAVAEFSEEWINRVGLMGKVVKGPQLIRFEKHNKYKAVMVLSLFNKITGDPFVDAAKAFLVSLIWALDGSFGAFFILCKYLNYMFMVCLRLNCKEMSSQCYSIFADCCTATIVHCCAHDRWKHGVSRQSSYIAQYL